AQQRIDKVEPGEYSAELYEFPDKRNRRRIPFGALLERGLVQPGQMLFFGKGSEQTATILANGKIKYNGSIGSIHQVAKAIYDAPCNGWDHWYYEDADTGEHAVIDKLRERVRADMKAQTTED
ncbi:MAG: site-specific DNA-methyltransferase, partial [Anaerolineales bacterium]